jgi:hypothetical protein
MRNSHGTGLRLCCWDKGRNTNYPEHQICRKANALNSYTVREIKIKNGFWVALIFLNCLGPDDYLLFSWFAKQQSISQWGPCCRVFKVAAESFMLTATTTGRAVERSTRCHQGGSRMCPARDVPYGHRNQGTRRLPVPQRVHTNGKAAPRRPALLQNIFVLNWYCKICFSVDGSVVLCYILLWSWVRTRKHVEWYWCCFCGHLPRLCLNKGNVITTVPKYGTNEDQNTQTQPQILRQS